MRNSFPALILVSACCAPPASLEDVVKVEGTFGYGSGCVVACERDGDQWRVGILTAGHVVDHSGGLRPFGVEVLEVDRCPTEDLALIWVRSPVPSRVFRIRWDPPAFGEPVRSAGYPVNDPLLPQAGLWGVEGWTSTDVAPGMSGGPVVDAQGRLVAIVVGAPMLDPVHVNPTITQVVPIADVREWLEPLL